MPSEMVERVARAIADRLVDMMRDGHEPSAHVPVEIAWERMDAALAGPELARAAIAAMREPTAEMRMRVVDEPLGIVWPLNIWQAMIDGALYLCSPELGGDAALKEDDDA